MNTGIERRAQTSPSITDYGYMEETVILTRTVKSVLRGWKILAACGIIGGISGAGVASRQPDQFSSTATVKLETQDSGLTADYTRRLNDVMAQRGVQAIMHEYGNPSADIQFSLKASSAGPGLIDLSATSINPDAAFGATEAYENYAEDVTIKDYEDRQKAIEAIRERTGKEFPNVLPTLIREVIPPERPFTPNNKNRRIDKGALGALLGAMSAAAGLVLFGYLRGRIENKSEAEVQLGIPGLAEIQMPKGIGHFSANQNGEVWSTEGVNRVNFSDLKEKIDRLLLPVGENGKGKIIAVGSFEGGEGKTTTALGLAARCAVLGETKVLVVDADFHRPSLGEKLSIENGHGLTDMIRDENLNPSDLIHQTKYGFDVMTAGKVDNNTSWLLDSPEFAKAMDRFRHIGYDYIFVDMPPAVAGPDDRLIAKNCDGIVLVVGTQTDGLTRSGRGMVEDFQGCSNVLGVVVNGVPYKNSAYYKYN